MYTTAMSKEADRIIKRSNTEYLQRLKMKELGGEIVKKRANELLRDFDLTNMGEPKFKAKRFLELMIPKITLINEVDPETNRNPYSVEINHNYFLVLEDKWISGRTPDPRRLKYDYSQVTALGCKKDGKLFKVGFFKRNEIDPYIFEDPDRGIFLPLDAGMLFTKTVTEEEIIPTLALAMASYEYNKGKPLNEQVTFPSEI